MFKIMYRKEFLAILLLLMAADLFPEKNYSKCKTEFSLVKEKINKEKIYVFKSQNSQVPDIQLLFEKFDPGHFMYHPESFYDGRAIVKVKEKYGFIDTTGKIVIPPKFVRAERFSEGMAMVKDEQNGMGYINKSAEFTIIPNASRITEFSEGLALVVTIFGKSGFIDKTGKIAIPPLDYKGKYSFPGKFSEGMASFLVSPSVNGNFPHGFINKSGKIAIPPQFESADNFSEGLASVRVDGKYGFINKTGKFVIPPRFESASSFSEGLAVIRESGSSFYGYINKTGKVVIPPQFYSANKFSEGLAWVHLNNGKYSYIDKTGKVAAPLRQEEGHKYHAENYSEGLASLREEGKSGFIDRTGNVIVSPQFTHVYSASGGIAAVEHDGKYGFINFNNCVTN